MAAVCMMNGLCPAPACQPRPHSSVGCTRPHQPLELPLAFSRGGPRPWPSLPDARYSRNSKRRLRVSLSAKPSEMGEKQTQCTSQRPLWVKSKHMQCKKPRPLYPESGHSGAKRNVRYRPQADICIRNPRDTARGFLTLAISTLLITVGDTLRRTTGRRSSRRDRCHQWRLDLAGSNCETCGPHSRNERTPYRPPHSASRPLEEVPCDQRVRAWRHQGHCWSSFDR